MKKFLIGTAAIALIASGPASAQLLNGGGVAGGLGGSLGSTIGGTRVPVDTVTDAESAARVDRSVDLRNRQAGVTGSTVTNVNNAARISGRSTSQNATAAGNAGLNVDASNTRGALAATRSGLQRAATTASGVPVFVPSGSIAAPAAVTNVGVRTYPTFNRGIYYGANGVFIGQGEVGYYMDRQYRDLQRGFYGTGARVFRRGDNLVVQLPADVTFAFDRADIRPKFVGALNAFARTLQAYPATDVEIMGHTDSLGSDSYNLSLSERRGRSVADFLVARDAQPNRLVVEALGETQPVASNATASGRAANRRVEFVLHPRVS